MSETESNAPDLQPIFRVLEVYKSYEELKFPGVSAESLSEATSGIDDQIEEIERLEIALGDAREALFAKHQAVIELARQAHGYATLFANTPSALAEAQGEGMSARLAELREELSSIQFEDSSKGARKRRPKAKTSQTNSPPPVTDHSEGEAKHAVSAAALRSSAAE